MPDTTLLRPHSHDVRAVAGRVLLALPFACAAMPAAADDALLRTPAGNVYIAAESSAVRDPIDGDLVAVGGRLAIDRPVARDALVAAGTLEVRAPVHDDLRAAAGSLTIAAPIGGEAMLAGGFVTIAEAGSIGGGAWIAAGTVELRGSVDGEAAVFARTLVVDGLVRGALRFEGDRLRLGPGADIRGHVVFASPRSIDRDPAARVEGEITRLPLAREAESRRHRGPWHGGGRLWAALLLLPFLAVGAVWLTTALLGAMLPGPLSAVSAILRAEAFKSLGVGVLSAAGLPVVLVALFASVLGIPLGIALAAVATLAAIVGYVAVVWTIGDRLLARHVARRGDAPTPGRRLAWLALAALVMVLIALVPFIGALLNALAVLAGAGAWILWSLRRRDKGGAATVAVTEAIDGSPASRT